MIRFCRIWLQDREHEKAVALKEGFGKGREEGRKETRAEYESLLAVRDAEIARLRDQLEKQNSGNN